MRARTFVIATATAAAGITAGLLGSGPATAITPVTVPPTGGVGIELNHAETQAFADGPIPALIDELPSEFISVGIEHDSQLPRRGNHVVADLPSVVGEAAGKPNGRVAVIVQPGPGLSIAQIW